MQTISNWISKKMKNLPNAEKRNIRINKQKQLQT